MAENRCDAELPDKMASLDLMEIDKDCSALKHSLAESADTLIDATEKIDAPRVLRKRKSIMPQGKASNRRVCMKPRKRLITENAHPKQIEALYLNKTVKTVSQTLETIYEEPKSENSDEHSLVGGRKVRRLLTFQLGRQYTKDKIKKRRAKIKKLLGNKSFLNRKKIPMHTFLENIECLELDETVQCENVC